MIISAFSYYLDTSALKKISAFILCSIFNQIQEMSYTGYLTLNVQGVPTTGSCGATCVYSWLIVYH